ncbi:IclR family transcriptional regulator [Rothia aerolata]|uniref:IclR family transcriptional regulator n=1 Tax=Rothia aerolata TaxID=1812262 RepID=A0A917ITI1_9MICC|nr:IclR family transcriptional regulator [Rothia aerolata]GGH63348.1 hypothetical protein GCM10007359_14530 [Rothia aerolata]
MDRPKEFLQSADNTLRLILLLQEKQQLTVSQAAKELEIGVSTAHRTLQMLVFHEFAVETEDKRYIVGPSLSLGHKRKVEGDRLRGIVHPFLQKLAKETGETCHLVIRERAQVTFVHSVEGTHLIRVGKRVGITLPASKSAAGQHMLTHLSTSELRSLHPQLNESEFSNLRKIIQKARSQGFGINDGDTEEELSAVGCALTNEVGDILGGIAISIPRNRFKKNYPAYASSLIRLSREANNTLASISKDYL